MYCHVKCVLFSYSCIWYANWCGLILLQVLLCKETGVKNATLVDSAWKSCTNFQFPEINDFWEFVLCSNLRFNLFTVTIFDSNSIVWLACGIQLCQIQSVHWGKKYLEHDVWITPRNIIYLASCGIFLTAIFLIPFIYLVKELFAFSYILSQQ